MIAAFKETKDQLDSQISEKQAQLDYKDAEIAAIKSDESEIKKELSQRDALIAKEQDMIE